VGSVRLRIVEGYVFYPSTACLRTAETPLHAAPLVSASYGAPFTRLQQPRIAAHCTFGAETAQDLALDASGLSGHLAQAASTPEPRHTRRAALLVPPYLRRRKSIIRAFGTEGQHRSVGLFLHNKTHITRAASAFPLNHHCKTCPI
jgi:hypothetical protein